MSSEHFSFYKIEPHNLNLDYPHILTNPIVLRFPKLYFSPLVQTKIECFNKQLLVDINWINKAIWKSTLKKATKGVSLFEGSA